MTPTLIIAIRAATAADNGLLAELGARTFFDTFAKDNTAENMTSYLAEAFSLAQLTAELANPSATFFVAECAGSAIGYAMLRTSDPQPGLAGQRPVELVRLYVEQAWLGQGAGAALMTHCLASAVAHHDSIWLGVWEHNPRAIAFYQRWGFSQFGHHAFLLGDDRQIDLLFGRELPR